MNDEAEVQEEEGTVKNPIITPFDQERWPILEAQSLACDMPLNETDEAMIVRMDEVLSALDDEAVGLAAVQIGYPKRIFMIRKDGDNFVYVNPIITHKSRETKRDGEACLSLPGMGGVFKRPKSVTLQYLDLDGEVCHETFRGFWARVVMHEMDHLEGTLVSHHLEREIARQPRRTKFGMVVTPQKVKEKARRRASNKRARKERRRQRA